MFLDEAAIAARIDHPNVCTVFDFGWEDIHASLDRCLDAHPNAPAGNATGQWDAPGCWDATTPAARRNC